MKNIGHFSRGFSLLCAITLTLGEPYSSDDYIKHINEVQRQWRAGRNFDVRTEVSLLNFYLMKMGHPLIPEVAGRSFWTWLFGSGDKGREELAASPTTLTIADTNTNLVGNNGTSTEAVHSHPHSYSAQFTTIPSTKFPTSFTIPITKLPTIIHNPHTKTSTSTFPVAKTIPTTKTPITKTPTTKTPIAKITATTNTPIAKTTPTTKTSIAKTPPTTKTLITKTNTTTKTTPIAKTPSTKTPIAKTTPTTKIPIAKTTPTTKIPIAITTPRKMPTTIEPVKEEEADFIEDEVLPWNFDARDNWPHCKDIISRIIESPPANNCSNDWATSVVGAIEDRYCIKFGVTNRTFSVSQIVECCPSCEESCQQGSAEKAYNYFQEFGVPSGAQVQSTYVQTAAAGCRPYSNGFVKSKTNMLSCLNKCPNVKYKTSFEEDLVKIQSYYELSTDATVNFDGRVSYSRDTIKQEIRQFGSVTATINFYRDLLYYKEGIYAPLDDAELMGEISVKVIGWGIEQGNEYWLVSNNWKKSWGNRGFAKIEAWNEKLDLESRIMAGRL